MNRLFFVLALGLLGPWHAPSLEAASVDCVPDKGCPKGMKPPKCCALPKCEFFYALMLARAELHAHSGSAQFGALAEALEDPEGALRSYRQTLGKVLKEARAKNRKCPTKDFYVEPPPLLVLATEQCGIYSYATGERREIGLDEFQLRSNSCSEIVEAEWAQALQEQFQCNRPNQPSAWENIDAYRKRNQSAARVKVRSLEASLLQYRRACTMVTDAKIARHVAKLGLKALDDDYKKKPQGKKKSKRARKAR